MVAVVNFNIFSQDLSRHEHDFQNDTIKVLLFNSAPDIADIQVDTVNTPCTLESTSNITEIAAGNGYTKGGLTLTVSSTDLDGDITVVKIDNTVLTASGGSIGPFRYAVFYNDSRKTTSTRPVIAYSDRGFSASLSSGDSLAFNFDQTNGFARIG